MPASLAATSLHDAAFAVVSSSLLGVYSLLRGPRNIRNIFFAGFMFSCAVLSLGALTIYNAETARQAELWGYATRWGFMLLPAFFLAFCAVFAPLQSSVRVPVVVTAFVVGTFFAAVSWTSWMVPGFVRQGPYFKPVYGPGYLLFFPYLLGCFGCGVWIVARLYRRADPYQRNRHKLFLAGLAVAAVVSALSYLTLHRFEYPTTTISVQLTTAVMALAFLKHRLFSPSTALRLGVGMMLVAVMLIPLYALVVLTLEHFHGPLPVAESVVIGLVLVVIAVGLPTARAWAMPIALTLGRRRIMNVERLVELGGSLVGRGSTTEVIQLMVEQLEALTGSECILVFLEDQPGHALRLANHVGSPSLTVDSADAGDTPDWLLDRGKETLVQDLQGERSPAATAAMRWMSQNQVQLALPVQGTGYNRTLVLLGAPAGAAIYDPYDIDALRAYASSVAVALRTAARFETNQVDRQIEHLSLAVGGLAHTFRNNLQPARMFLTLLPDKQDDPEFMGSYRELALGQLQQALSVVQQLRQLNVEQSTQLSTVDVIQVVRDVVNSHAPETAGVPAPVQLEAPQQPISARLDPMHLNAALSNLLLNALSHASGQAVQVKVAPHGSTAPTRSDHVLISITNCEVIPEEILDRVFTPFFTTRRGSEESGTGLGLPIARKLIRRMGGTLTLRSLEGEGTTVTVSLPLS